jgi:hypothetical protein
MKGLNVVAKSPFFGRERNPQRTLNNFFAFF